MLDKISKLVIEARTAGGPVYDGLLALAERLEDKLPKGRGYVLLDIDEMESLLNPDKADERTDVGHMEMTL